MLDPTDEFCNGRKASGDGHCRRPPGWGTDHPGIGRCKRHGGSTPLYQQRVQKLKAAQAVEQYGLSVEVDPHTALEEELARTAGHVYWLRGQVGDLDPDNMYGPVGGGPQAIPSTEAHIWIRLYQEERDRLVKVAKTCIDAGIEERRVRIAEQQGQLIATAIKGILSKLGLADDPRVPEVVRAELLQLTAGSAP